ncbi:LacI family DNA-binding transcriptional regulator [Microbacterium sp. M1A1_1b]|uniref:LacI family DNA-binding transcriptional regulator n=1 Tax=Curtobacterium sp. VKM Ac-2922 TaxID=2929475 RepID=UPI001FB44F35|nr:LacI family DNA-binding transcriptional regulator [Curtobacterium sp. VKM Ac-2922]MCJ1714218.1 LacI family transcriptional regulator [Curtobacterium sp. VKM Ac-2922]
MTDRRPPTIIDVAARAGVSKSLVSMVMRDDPGVSDARRAAVLSAAADLGYRPNRAAAILAGTRTRTIGVVVDDFRNPWYVPMLDGIRKALEPHGLRLTLADATTNAHLASSPFDDLVSLRVDGIVLAAESSPDLDVPDATPVVVAGVRALAPLGVDVVASDEAAGARLAIEHLLDLGHRSVAHLSGTGGSAAARRVAAVDRMIAADIAPVVVGEGATSEQAGHQAAIAVLTRHPSVTGIFAANDVMAMGAIAAARSLGLRVPEDVSVVGHDETPLAASPLVDLTTVDPHNVEVGRCAAERLVALIGTGVHPPATMTLVPPELVVRGTTAPPQ